MDYYAFSPGSYITDIPVGTCNVRAYSQDFTIWASYARTPTFHPSRYNQKRIIMASQAVFLLFVYAFSIATNNKPRSMRGSRLWQSIGINNKPHDMKRFSCFLSKEFFWESWSFFEHGAVASTDQKKSIREIRRWANDRLPERLLLKGNIYAYVHLLLIFCMVE